MNCKNLLFALIGFSVILTGTIQAQTSNEKALESITAAELRNHIFFLASDFLNGRYAPTPEYALAAEYVGTQFAAAGLEPVVKNEEGTMSFFQGVPFAKTTYSDKLSWSIIKEGVENELIHKEDFRILMGSNLNHEKLELVWAGYGIVEPDHNWNDLEDLDVEGKILVCMSGAPVKKGKPLLPKDIHEKYVGPRGFQSKMFGGLFTMGIAGIILVDIDGSSDMQFSSIPSQFSTEKYVYKGNQRNRRRGSFPSIYIVKPEFLNLIMSDSKNNPLNDPENILKNYEPMALDGTYLNSGIEILNENVIASNNVIGMVTGTDPVLKDEYIVVGAHLDHVVPQQGQPCNGADDNASGSSGVMEIAEAVAMNPCKRSVIFITYTAEEMGLIGSRFFLNSDLFAKEKIKFNINMDMIGRSDRDHEKDRAHYVVSNKKYVDQIESFIVELNDGVTDFPLIFDNDQESPGGSDHQTFIGEDIPAFFFFSGVHEDLHNPGDDPEKIDYPKAESISKLGYLMVQKLGNMDKVPTFLKIDK